MPVYAVLPGSGKKDGKGWINGEAVSDRIFSGQGDRAGASGGIGRSGKGYPEKIRKGEKWEYFQERFIRVSERQSKVVIDYV